VGRNLYTLLINRSERDRKWDRGDTRATETKTHRVRERETR